MIHDNGLQDAMEAIEIKDLAYALATIGAPCLGQV